MTGSAHNALAVEFGQSVDKVMSAVLYTVIGRQVHHLKRLGQFMRIHELAGFAMGSTTEKHIYFI